MKNLLEIGTSGVVYPAAGFSFTVAARGVPVAEVNIESTYSTAISEYAVLFFH